eukprot:SAG31_NODE_535_length_14348_cov_11.339603_20_plen_148_part_00
MASAPGAVSDLASLAPTPGRLLLLINAHMFLRVAISCQILAAEPLLITAMMGDPSVAMRVLAACSGASGFLQFALNPTFGTLSDTFGRKLFFEVGPAWCIIGDALIGLFPSSVSVFAVCRVLNRTMRTLSGSTVSSAALSDCATIIC